MDHCTISLTSVPLTIINHFCLCVMHRPLSWYIILYLCHQNWVDQILWELCIPSRSSLFWCWSPAESFFFYLAGGQFLSNLICTALSVFVSPSQRGDKNYKGGLESIHLYLFCFFLCFLPVLMPLSWLPWTPYCFKAKENFFSPIISSPWPSWLLSFIPFKFSLDF